MSQWEDDAGMEGDVLADLVEQGKLTDEQVLIWITLKKDPDGVVEKALDEYEPCR